MEASDKKIPGVFVPARFVEKVGSGPALILAQIIYWFCKASHGKSRYLVDRFGQRWLAHSRQQLMQETGMTKSQLKGALSRLKCASIIRIEQHLYRSKNVSHIRLHEKCPIWVGEGMPAGMALSDILETAEDANSLKSKTQKKTKGDFGATSAPTSSDIDSGKYGATSKDGSNGGGESPGKLAIVFRQAFAEVYPDLDPPDFTSKQMGQFKNVLQFAPSGEASAVVDFAVRNWGVVLSYAKHNDGAFDLPKVPKLGFLLKMLQSAVNAYDDHISATYDANKKAPWVCPGLAEITAVAEKEPAQIASLEECAAILYPE